VRDARPFAVLIACFLHGDARPATQAMPACRFA
jgi:hypothetical protein